MLFRKRFAGYLLAVSSVGLAGTLVSPSVNATPMGYALADGGTSLVSFTLSDPGTTTSVALTGGTLDAIDFRPATGELFGYDDATDAFFTVDTSSGVLTPASTTVTATDTDALDIDWNPTIDRMRTITATDQNIVYNPNTGTASDAATTPLFYVAGDANDGANPNIVANGYTNSVAGAMTTQQFALDSDLNVLVTLGNNAGTLNTIGSTGVDFDANAGLDVLTVGMSNTLYALLTVSGVTSLYALDATSGAATMVGVIGSSLNDLAGLAVANIPEPSMLLLLSGGVLLLARRRALNN
ncbi:MAG: DUF4394 domain-containing protein [Gammaproteobacteria bacterium]|nr:DUF4394 domain-containing protein [Gammaproteobacteria bacterium]